VLIELTLYLDRLESRFGLIKDALEESSPPPARLNWRPGSEDPSIFGLAAFVAMNTDYWIGHALGNLPEPLGFDRVLEEAQGDDFRPLIKLLDNSLETSRRVLEKLTAAELDSTINFNDEPLTPRQAIVLVLEDAAERYGEINALSRWWENK